MRRDTVTRSIFDSPLLGQFIKYAVIISLICLIAIFGRYIGNLGGFFGSVCDFIISIYKFPAYYLVASLGGDVDGLRMFFYIMIDMAIISTAIFFVKIIITGELKEEIETYRGDE